MTVKFKGLFFAVSIFLILLQASCAERIVQSSETIKKEAVSISLSEFSQNSKGYEGEIISSNGYLTPLGPIMVLIEPNEKNPFSKPSILISAPSLWEKPDVHENYVDLARYFSSLGCTDKFVKIVGEVGLIEEQKVRGIIEIRNILVFEDSTFQGEGRNCFPAN